ncbi:hypothetical protein [Clostridioides sp. ES-S-0108-01]
MKPIGIDTNLIFQEKFGTGSEVTNVAIAELKSKHTKKGLAVEEPM